MKKILYMLLSAASLQLSAQRNVAPQRIIYGICSKDSLMAEPFASWYSPSYNSYKPAIDVITNLKKLDLKDISIKIFFGSWCGDSKREVPRFYKIASAISMPEKNTQLIGLGGSDSLYKQSPTHEEADLGIYRVPVFIIYKNGKEINRINEYPAYSLEKDLLTILTGNNYVPNYKSFSKIREWMANGTLTDENVSARGLGEQLRSLVSSENELNSLGYLMLKQGKKKEALKIFQINYNLFSTSANIASSLGEGYYENGDYKRAIAMLEYALEINKESAAIKEMLNILYNAKAKE